ncbi:carbohydrate ABC transporter permease [Catenuloplanes sp. NPDC051500]|uniref:carbohydrate ABC transporter permease n=1 Tax=Catenuloplanes sp. NPDC051500 TaxID=3363959 RepID=UPI0037AE7337
MTTTIARPAVSPPAQVTKKRVVTPYLLLAPATVVVFATLLYPVGRMVALSFQRGNLGDLITRRTVWVGLDNYRAVLSDQVFWTVLPRTLGFAAVCVALTLVIATGCALLLQHASQWARVTLSVGMVIAWATPVLIGAVIFKWLFDAEFGVVNWLLTESGLCDCRHRSWLGDQWSAFAVLVSIVVWGAVPFAALSVYAGLLTVPPELGEAARVDGAGAIRIFRQITFPLLRPIYAILTVLSVIWDTKVFPQVWLTTKGGPYQGTVMLGVYIYQKGIVSSQFGVASTIAVLMTIMLVGLSWFYIRTMRQEAR